MEERRKIILTPKQEFILNSTPEEIWEALEEDLDHTFECFRRNDSQFWRRTVVRTFFSYVEAILFSMRARAYQSFEDGEAEYSLAEVALMLGESYDLSGQGRALTRPYFGSIDRSFRFIFDVWARGEGFDFRPNYDDHGWDLFRRAVKIRNQITHPKSVTDLIIGDEEMGEVIRGMQWFFKNHIHSERLLLNRGRRAEQLLSAILDRVSPKRKERQEKK